MSLQLVLRRASVSRKGDSWQHEDYDVFDGEYCVDRIFLQASGAWFWGVDFFLTRRKSYGDALTLDEAKAAFRAEYEAWRGTKEGARRLGPWTGRARASQPQASSRQPRR